MRDHQIVVSHLSTTDLGIERIGEGDCFHSDGYSTTDLGIDRIDEKNCFHSDGYSTTDLGIERIGCEVF